MNNPNWNDAPEWASYLAMDSDGRWFWFEKKPSIQCGFWDARGRLVEAYIHIDGWDESLEKRP